MIQFENYFKSTHTPTPLENSLINLKELEQSKFELKSFKDNIFCLSFSSKKNHLKNLNDLRNSLESFTLDLRIELGLLKNIELEDISMEIEMSSSSCVYEDEFKPFKYKILFKFSSLELQG